MPLKPAVFIYVAKRTQIRPLFSCAIGISAAGAGISDAANLCG